MWIYLGFKWSVWYKLIHIILVHNNDTMNIHYFAYNVIVCASRQARKSWAPDVNPEVRMKDEFLHFLGVSRAIHRMLQKSLVSVTCRRWPWVAGDVDSSLIGTCHALMAEISSLTEENALSRHIKIDHSILHCAIIK